MPMPNAFMEPPAPDSCVSQHKSDGSSNVSACAPEKQMAISEKAAKIERMLLVVLILSPPILKCQDELTFSQRVIVLF